MKIYTILVVLLFNFIFLFSNDYQSNKITVKFKNNPEILDLINSNSSYELVEFTKLLGKYTAKPFVNKNLLYNLKSQFKNDNNLLSNSKVFSLDRIFIFEYSKDTDPEFAASKISTLDYVDYAEPLYNRYIFNDSLPNDSLFSEQYYLQSINALEAWKHIDTSGKVVKIAVVDTGVDYLHEDLAGNMQNNQGEVGLDEQGNDKRFNGVDDDVNGFIDDWMGMDFGAENELGYDNDPAPGNPHGTHVAGIIAATKNNLIGISGIGLNTKIIPVKIGYDNPSSRSLVNSYDGLLYAAIAGADVINCSWGGGGYSQAEQEIIDQAVALGSLIVAAAGNDASPIAFYPASYDGVISVAAVDALDQKANFSNYYSTVDVSAPGVKVMSTIPNNEYVAWDGTSMASPVAAAVAGMIRLNYPEYNNFQIGEHLKATSRNIYDINPNFVGMLGVGRVDAQKAVTEVYPVSLSLKSYTVSEEINDGVIKSGERVDIVLELFNSLKPIKNVVVKAVSNSENPPIFINDELFAGDFGELESKVLDGKISFFVTNSQVLNYNMPLTIIMTDQDGRIFSSTISIFVNPSWRTMKENSITLTYTSQGNIAYDDFPSNNRGEGFKINSGPNLLFEGALMFGYDVDLFANVARGSSGSAKNRDFIFDKPIVSIKPYGNAAERTYSEYLTREDSLVAPLRVIQNGFQFIGNGLDNVSYVVYDLVNLTKDYQDSVFAALYLDWDIGPSGSNNVAVWHKNGEFAYQHNALAPTLPYVAIKMISNQRNNFWAIDNDGDTEDNPGVYDGFTRQEKWMMMSSGVGRELSSSTDASMVIGAGPMAMKPNDTIRVAFALFSGNSLQELETISESISKNLSLISPDGNFDSTPKQSTINVIYPNPTNNYATIELLITDIDFFDLELWDMNGKFIKSIYSYKSTNENKLYPGYLRIYEDFSGLSQGQYIINFRSKSTNASEVLILQK